MLIFVSSDFYVLLTDKPFQPLVKLFSFENNIIFFYRETIGECIAISMDCKEDYIFFFVMSVLLQKEISVNSLYVLITIFVVFYPVARFIRIYTINNNHSKNY